MPFGLSTQCPSQAFFFVFDMPRYAPIHVPPTQLDRIVADTCYRLASPRIEPIFRALTWLADEKLMLAGAGAVWLGMRSLSRDRALSRAADQMLLSVAISAAVPHVAKLAFVRERPDRTRVGSRRKGIPKSGKAFDSFPSGHAVHVGALAAAADGMAPGHRAAVWSTALALAGTRVVLLAHNLTDVIAGLMVGIAINRLVARLFGFAGMAPPQNKQASGRGCRPEALP